MSLMLLTRTVKRTANKLGNSASHQEEKKKPEGWIKFKSKIALQNHIIPNTENHTRKLSGKNKQKCSQKRKGRSKTPVPKNQRDQ